MIVSKLYYNADQTVHYIMAKWLLTILFNPKQVPIHQLAKILNRIFSHPPFCHVPQLHTHTKRNKSESSIVPRRWNSWRYVVKGREGTEMQPIIYWCLSKTLMQFWENLVNIISIKCLENSLFSNTYEITYYIYIYCVPK